MSAVTYENPLDGANAGAGEQRLPRQGTLKNFAAEASTALGSTAVKLARNSAQLGRRGVMLVVKSQLESETIRDERIHLANTTFKRLFNICDYSKDRSLRLAELRAGLQVVGKAFSELSQVFKVDMTTFAKLNLCREAAQLDYLSEECDGKSVDELSVMVKEAWGNDAPATDAVQRLIAMIKKTDRGRLLMLEQEGCTVHVRGMSGDLEHEEALRNLFGRFGRVSEIVIRHRVDNMNANTSWALVSFERREAVAKVSSSSVKTAAGKELTITKFSADHARESKGAMLRVSEQLSAKSEAGKSGELTRESSFAQVREYALEIGIPISDVEATAGWGADVKTLRDQYLAAKLRKHCGPEDVMDCIYPCAVTVLESAGGKLPASLLFCDRVGEILEEDVSAVDQVRESILEESQKASWNTGRQSDSAEKEEERLRERKVEMQKKMMAKLQSAKTAVSAGETDGEMHHPDYERLLEVLTDPYFLHIVLPQVESWQTLFNIFDLKRNGRVSYSELCQGLRTSCAPEIEIVQNATMVQHLLKSMAFVAKEKELIRSIFDLCVDNPPPFGASEEYASTSQISTIFKRNPSAVHYCIAHYKSDWDALKTAARRVGDMVSSRSDLTYLDGAVYNLRFVVHTLVRNICRDLRSTRSDIQTDSFLKDELHMFKRDLHRIVTSACTEALVAHRQLFKLAGDDDDSPIATLVLRKLVRLMIHRKRAYMIRRVTQWEAKAVKKKKQKLKFKNGTAEHVNGASKDGPLVKLQAIARGSLERRRIENVRVEAIMKSDGLLDDEELIHQHVHETTSDNGNSDDDEETAGDTDIVVKDIDYFDWPNVFTHYLRFNHKVEWLSSAAVKILEDQALSGVDEVDNEVEALKLAKSSGIFETEDPGNPCLEETQTVEDGALSTDPASESSGNSPDYIELHEFPHNMLNEQLLARKLVTLRHTIHTWHELVMMLDTNNSGSLGADELQYTILAFASMGLITEALEYQPMDERSHPKTEELFLQQDGKTVGWSETTQKLHKLRQDFECRCTPGKVIEDYPIYISPGECILMGKEGIPVGQHPWVLQVDFQYDSKCQNRGLDRDMKPISSDYSVLVSSYRNNTIVVRKCGTKTRPGIQLLFIKQDAYQLASTVIPECEKHAKAGRNGFEDEIVGGRVEDFPDGRGTFEITPFIPMEELRWYRMIVQGDKLSELSYGSRENLQRLRVRIDPLGEPSDPKQRNTEVIGDQMLVYSGGQCKGEQAKTIPNGQIPNATQPWFCTEWTGIVDFQDFYCIGNVYDNLCTDALDEVEFSIGALRNITIFSCKRPWLHAVVRQWPSTCNRDSDGAIDLGPMTLEHKNQDSDVMYWLRTALNTRDYQCSWSRSWSIKGIFQMIAKLHSYPKSGMYSARLYNTMDTDHEPEFPYSNGIVDRFQQAFLHSKWTRTTELVRALMTSVPHKLAPQCKETADNGEVPKGDMKYWLVSHELEFDANTLFQMRGETARDDPGLNMLFTGQQLQGAMRNLTRRKRVNRKKCNSVFRLFFWPLTDLYKHCFRRHKKVAEDSQFAGYLAIVHVLHKSTGSSAQAKWVLYLVALNWVLTVFAVAGVFQIERRSVHGLEPAISALYFLWAGLLMGLECSSEVAGIPSDTPFNLAYRQARLSMQVLNPTRLADGQKTHVTAMGLLSMVCHLHSGKEEEDLDQDDDADDDGSDPFNVARRTLAIFWQQSTIEFSLPFADKGISSLEALNYFVVDRDVFTPLDWDEKMGVYMQGMQTRVDTGKPSTKGFTILVALATVNATLGVVHRLFMGVPVLGDTQSEAWIVVSCCIVTFICSFFVYSTIYKVAFTWYTVLIFMEQFGRVLGIEGAMRVHLPCYIDLRHEGNLEGWYMAREYLNLYCDIHIFGTKQQLVIASALIASVLVSLSAISNYFGDSTQIDWSDPGGLFSIFNIFVLAGLSFLGLIALERINVETNKLIKKLDVVGIEVSRSSTVAQTARERLQKDELAMQLKEEANEEDLHKRIAKAALLQAAEGKQLTMAEKSMVRQMAMLKMLLKTESSRGQSMMNQIDIHTNDIINRQEIANEYQHLMNIISELRDQTESKKIIGMNVDRVMLSRMFSGLVAVLYIIAKDTVDKLIIEFGPPTPMMGAMAGGDGTVDGSA